MMHQFLMQWDANGNLQGAHLMGWDGVNPPSPKNVQEFTPDELKNCPEWLVPIVQKIDTAGVVAQLQAENAALKNKLAPAINEILPKLETAGLSEWAGAVITAATDNAAAVDLVIALRAIAAEPPSWSQCDRIKELFGALVEMSGVIPTPEQAQAMQQILDKGADSTGPVSAEKLNFHRFFAKG